MGFQDAVRACLTKYADFTGRSARSEFWYFFLFNFVVQFVLSLLGNMISIFGILSGLVALALLLPGLAVSVRRLHDIDRSGWWLLIGFVPLVGAILLIVWDCTAGTPGDNRFGRNPLAA